ncbi:hypothetical protein GIB67_011070 [Kingdonia uniflora]|uniref:Uncharacterized protein n=1 Tax=Kingdonia uniflora TaxID=39325 RepID=A0A7J7L6M4_9MAGN|nr:hypothetical protein GIB67_011070 [Kingdonia uniflora]
MKSDKEVNEQVDEENQTQEGKAKKGTSNAKNYTSWCTEDVLRLNLLKIILSFLLPNKGNNVEVGYVDLVDDLDQFNKFLWEISNQSTRNRRCICNRCTYSRCTSIGSSSSATKIRAVVLRVCSQLEEHGKMLHTHENRETQARTKKDEDGKMKKAEPRIKKGKGEWQNKAEEADVPNKKKKVEGLKKEALTDEQFDHVPLIQLKTLIPKIPKKGLANRQVAPGEILEVENALMVEDNVEVGREVNFNAISSEYGGDLLEKKGKEKDNDDKKDGEEKVKSEEEKMEESKNADEKVDGDEKVDDVAEEEDSEQPTVVVYYTEKNDVQLDNDTMVVAEVAKADIVFFNQEEVVGETYQASADQTTAVSVEEQTLELVLMESEVDVTSKKRHALTEEENNENAFKMACRMNQLHAHLDELLLGVLLESFIQRPISKDEKSQVDQVWSLRKGESTPEAKKGNRSTYMMIGEEPTCLNALYALYPNKWLDNEVIDVYIKALIQFFDTQHCACPDKERIGLADIFACQYIGRAFSGWSRYVLSRWCRSEEEINLRINYIYAMGTYIF